METNDVTKIHRERQGLSVRDFSDVINSQLINTGMSPSMVSRIENDHYEPPLQLLFECIATYGNSWVSQWAVDSFSAMYPDLVQSGIVTFHLPKTSIKE